MSMGKVEKPSTLPWNIAEGLKMGASLTDTALGRPWTSVTRKGQNSTSWTQTGPGNREMMESCRTAKLYKAYTFTDDDPDWGSVCFERFYIQRQRPLAPYEKLIEGYNLPFEVWASYGPRRTDRIHLSEAKYLDPSRSIGGDVAGESHLHQLPKGC
jgi:hypothetical protein